MTDTATVSDPPVSARPAALGGLALAVISSAAFAMSGPLAKPLLAAGWSSGAAVLVRIGGAALLMLIPTLVLLWRDRGRSARANWRFLLGYGLCAIAGAQLGFFSAIQTLPVGVALLIEYLAPVLVVLWLWVRRGQRPSLLTALGGAIAVAGLVLVIDLTGAGTLNLVGVTWALLASMCLVVYFVLSAQVADDLSPVLVVGAGMVIGWLALAVATVLEVLPFVFVAAPASLSGLTLPWWGFALLLVLVATVFAYLTGIAAVSRLGPRLASFVALSEVVFAAALSWLLLGQSLSARQLLGGAFILAGVVLVRLGERAVDPLQALPDAEPPVSPPAAPEPRAAP